MKRRGHGLQASVPSAFGLRSGNLPPHKSYITYNNIQRKCSRLPTTVNTWKAVWA